MKPNRCSFCKGKLFKGKAEFVAKVGKEMPSIKNVPAYICEECREAYYSAGTSKKIDKIMRDFHENKLLAHPIATGEIDIKKAVA